MIPVSGRNTDFVISQSRGEIYHASNSGVLSVFDLESFELLAQIELGEPAPFLANLALDDRRGRLYLTRFLGGDVLVFDLERREQVDRVQLGQGLRFVALAPGRELLAVSNYMSGELYLLRAADLQTLAVLDVGRRPRWIDVAADESCLALCSGAGALVIELDAVPGVPRYQPPPTVDGLGSAVDPGA
ncbi:MAG: hypothetical protein P9M14_16050 [Candidatus Alcyoniella australis]|nr:hypothetical protein [Candidatus Alcyoniella australis]